MKKFLIIKPSSLGDVIHTFPVVFSIAEHVPDTVIDWVVRPEYAEIVRAHPAVHAVFLFERERWSRWSRSLTTVPEVVGLIRSLRRERYDAVLDLQGLFRSALIAVLSGAGERIGFANAREGADFFYNHKVKVPSIQVHAIERYQLFLKALNLDALVKSTETPSPLMGEGRVRVKYDNRSRHHTPLPIIPSHQGRGNKTYYESLDLEIPKLDYRLRIEAATERSLDDLLSAAGGRPASPLMVLNPNARWETKRWLPERFAALADRLIVELKAEVVFVGSAADKESVERIVSSMERKARNLAGRTSLLQLAALLKRADLMVTCDSGPMHLAAAMGTRVLALFGPTDPVRTGPYGPGHRVLRHELDCVPCLKRSCPPGSKACMEGIKVDAVFEAAVSLLAWKRQDRRP